MSNSTASLAILNRKAERNTIHGTRSGPQLYAKWDQPDMRCCDLGKNSSHALVEANDLWPHHSRNSLLLHPTSDHRHDHLKIGAPSGDGSLLIVGLG